MKRLLAVLFAVAVALPVAADTQVVCSISAQAETACSAITVSQAGQFDQCRCNQNAPAPAGPFGGHATLADGLVSYWPLDEESGVRADLAGTNDLTDNNTVLYANTGPQGVVADFLSANVEKLTKASPGFDWTGAWTLSIWAKWPANATYYEIFGVVSDPIRIYRHSDTTSLIVTFRAGSVVPASSVVGTGWNHIVAWHSAGSYGYSLNNGTAVTESGLTDIAGGNLSIGTYADGASNANTGQIGPTGFWSRVLTADERTSLYNSGNGKSYASLTTAEKVGLASYWNMTEASGNRADSHGSNDLTDNNTVTSVDNTHPDFGRAASFVGTSNESLQKDSFADPSSDWCFTFWGYANGPAAGSYGGLISLFDTGVSERMRVSFQETDQYLVLDNAASAGAQQPSRDAWHFYAIWETGGVTYISIDNAAATSTANVMSAGVDSLRFGFGTWYLTGRIAHGAYWSRALTAQERSDLYAAGAGLFYED